jgi:hypothetical protein
MVPNMAAAKIENTIEPWHFQLLRVEEDRHRLRLPKQLVAAISWLTASQEDLPCLGMVGARGGMTICSLSLLGTRSKLIKKLSPQQLRRNTAGSELLDYARYAATSWSLTLSVEASRRALYLPEEARKLRLVPSGGELAAVFAAGEILEVWTAPDWIAHLRAVGRNVGRLEETALRELHSAGLEE